MGVSEIGFPQNVVYKQRIQTSDTLPVTIGASKYCEFLFDIDAGDRMTPLGIVGWGCDDKTQVFLLDFYMDNDLQTAKLILKNPYATTIAITSLYIDVLYSKQALDMSEVDVVDNLTTDSAVAALSARQGKILDEKTQIISGNYYCKLPDGTLMCWGMCTIPSGQGNGTVTLAVPFIDTNYGLTCTPDITTSQSGTYAGGTFSVQRISTNQLRFHRSVGMVQYDSYIYYTAIGRWK